MESSKLYKRNPEDLVSWVETPDETGVFEFTFNGVDIYNLFEDYPWKLTTEQKAIFDKENPYWKEFFKDRQ